MGENSDGGEINKRNLGQKPNSVAIKTRSFSTGSVSQLTKVQINEIIGIRNRQKTVKTYADKKNELGTTNNDNTQLPGLFEKMDVENTAKYGSDSDFMGFGNTENLEDHDQVFKPTFSVNCTPPLKPTTKESNSEMLTKKKENASKRNRSSITPEFERTLKRPCGRSNSLLSLEKDDCGEENSMHNEEYSLDVEKLMFEVFEALDKISVTSFKEISESTMKMDDRMNFYYASEKIHKSLTLLVHKIGVLEKENLLLKFQTQQKNNARQGMEKQQEPAVKFLIEANNAKPKSKTYAEASASKISTKDRNNPVEKKSTWTTPKMENKLETLVTIDQISDPVTTMQQLKQSISTKDIGGGFKNIKYLKSGAVLLESHNREQLESFRLALRDKSNIKIKETENINPMFMVTGIRKGLTNEEILEDIVVLNPEIEKDLGYTVKNKIKVVAKKNCRNPSKENWILQATPDVAKWYLKKRNNQCGSNESICTGTLQLSYLLQLLRIWTCCEILQRKTKLP